MGKPQTIQFRSGFGGANIEDNNALFVRVEDPVTDKHAFIVVPPTHRAIVLKGGNYKLYESGNYPVFETKDEIKAWKRLGSVEVIYIPKETLVLVKWGTPHRVMFTDKTSNKYISVGARGECRVCVGNPLQFYKVLVGNSKVFDLAKFSREFAETIVGKFEAVFTKAVNDKNITYDRFGACKEEIAATMGELLNPEFEEDYGLTVKKFIIADFDLSESDREAIESAAAEKRLEEKEKEEEAKREQRRKELLAEYERLDDKNWEREKWLRQLELSDKYAYYDVLKVIGQNPTDGKAKESEKLLCPNCNLEYKSSDKFCPHCGKRVSKEPIICPECGNSNAYDTKFCSNCGKKLV